MKRLYIIIFLFITIISLGQKNPTSQNPDKNKSILENRNDQLNIYFNFQSSFDVLNNQDNEIETAFKARQLRFEIKGNLTDQLFYRFRHRLNKTTEAQTLDNLAQATDIMYVGYKANDKLTIITGKQFQAWGGFEFDLNAIRIYEYSDFINYMNSFKLGANIIYEPIKNQEFQFQITDSNNARLEDAYGDLTEQNIAESNHPLTYIINWNGSFKEDMFKTRWSYGVQTQADNIYSTMIILGNQMNIHPFRLTFDYMYADDGIDRLMIATNDNNAYLASANMKVLEDVVQNSFVLKAEYKPHKKWNTFAKGMYETIEIDREDFEGKYRTAYGYLGGVEYIPLEDQDLKVFLAYVGRKFEYDPIIDKQDYNTDRVSLGLIYRVKAY